MQPRRRVDWAGYGFLLPFLIPFILFLVAPIGFGFFVAFTDWGITRSPEWVGTENFRRAITDPQVIKAFGNTARYALIIVPGVTILGFLFAVYVNQRWPGYVLARLAFFAPNVVSATVIALVWVWMLDTQYGLINQFFGLRIPWLTSTSWSLVGVSIASIWWDLGLVFILFLAALQEVDPELREAAAIDGASRWRTMRHVVLPLIRPTMSLVITLQLVMTLRIFSQINVMTQGGPSGSSMSVISYIYDFAISRQRLGYAAAVALLLFALILAVTLLQRRSVRETY